VPENSSGMCWQRRESHKSAHRLRSHPDGTAAPFTNHYEMMHVQRGHGSAALDSIQNPDASASRSFPSQPTT